MGFRAFLVGLAAAAVLGFSSNALASGGDYSVVGGTGFERLQVGSALNKSAFDWDMVPGHVTITIVRGLAESHSLPGKIWLDANLLDTGDFSWGVVQMEYAQQVHLTLVTAPLRAQLTTLLGAQQWCYDDPTLPRGANACERFAATLAWAYWPSPRNCMKPASKDAKDDWSAAMDPAAFRVLLRQLLGAPNAVRAASALPRVLAATHTIVQTARRADGSLRLRLFVPAGGVVTVSGAGVVRASVSARAQGAIGVWLKPTRVVRPGASRRVQVTVTFTAADGSTASAVQTVTFRSA